MLFSSSVSVLRHIRPTLLRNIMRNIDLSENQPTVLLLNKSHSFQPNTSIFC